MNLTTQNIKENFTPHELYTILNNYLEDGEFIKPTNDYLAELQKESLQELKIDLDVLNSYSIDFDDKYIVALSDDMYSTNELADCFNNYAMNEALEQYINDCTVYDDLASKISNLITNETTQLANSIHKELERQQTQYIDSLDKIDPRNTRVISSLNYFNTAIEMWEQFVEYQTENNMLFGLEDNFDMEDLISGALLDSENQSIYEYSYDSDEYIDNIEYFLEFKKL